MIYDFTIQLNKLCQVTGDNPASVKLLQSHDDVVSTFMLYGVFGMCMFSSDGESLIICDYKTKQTIISC